MKPLIALALFLSVSRLSAQPGLTGEYFTGTNFEQKILTRIDRQLRFNWIGQHPAPGLGESYYSIRWTGKLLAPASGRYDFSATIDDGIRVWIGTKKVIDAWALHDSDHVKGSIVLEAGTYYDLRVEYFNDLLGGRIDLLWHRPDDQIDGSSAIPAAYFARALPPAPTPPAPRPVAAVPPPTVPKPAPKPLIVKPKPVIVAATPAPAPPAPMPENKPADETFGTLETGKSLVLNNVFFEQSSYTLLPASFAELDKLVRTLQQNPAVRIVIAGHTDNVGDPRLNQTLSEYRARIIQNYLRQHGIAEERVEARGYGGTKPRAPNDTETDRAQNRRVEFTVK